MKYHSLIILYAVCLHLTWGATISFSGEIYHTTAIDEAYKWIGTEPLWCGTFFICVGILAGVPLVKKTNPVAAVLMSIPQQFILVLSSIGVIMAIINGHYADGTVATRLHILIDKCDIPLATAWHTVAIFRHYIFYRRDLDTWYRRFHRP